MRESRKTALITGASSGLGRELCRVLAAEGWQVFGAARRVDLIPGDANVTGCRLDVTQGDEVRSVVKSINAQCGGIDLLVNAAGVTGDGLICNLAEGDWNGVLDTNLKSAYLCARAVAPLMVKRRDGHIVNVTSFAAFSGHLGQSNYVAAKAGLIGLTQSLAAELGPRNIRVNAIMPGVMQTEMTAGLSAEQLAELAEKNHLGRLNSVAEVARFIHFLTTTQNISGQTFNLDSRISRWC